MAKLKAMFGTDIEKEVDGVWLELDGGLRLKIARFENTNHLREMNKGARRQLNSRLTGNVDQDALDLIQMQSVAKTVLVDWDGIEDESDVPVVYSPETALKLFKEFRDLYRTVLVFAQNVDNYKLQDDDEGN